MPARSRHARDTCPARAEPGAAWLHRRPASQLRRRDRARRDQSLCGSSSSSGRPCGFRSPTWCGSSSSAMRTRVRPWPVVSEPTMSITITRARRDVLWADLVADLTAVGGICVEWSGATTRRRGRCTSAREQLVTLRLIQHTPPFVAEGRQPCSAPTATRVESPALAFSGTPEDLMRGSATRLVGRAAVRGHGPTRGWRPSRGRRSPACG